MKEIELVSREEKPASRRGFLAKVGALLAVGLGAGVVPAVARAQQGICCKSNCTFCAPGQTAYWCSGCGFSCCDCQTTGAQCYNLPCPCG